MIYLDNAATTMVAPEVLEAMLPYLKDQYGNAGTIYSFGRAAATAVQEARSHVARLFGCDPDNVVFTSGGSEGNSMVFNGVKDLLMEQGKKHLIISAIEHESVLKVAKSLIKFGFEIDYVYPDSNGVVSVESIEKLYRDETGLVSVMFVNNETGAVNDVKSIGEFCRNHSVLYHCDCVQAAGQYELNVEDFQIDFATMSSHKIHGPKGVGALYLRDMDICPLVYGSGSQEFGLRGGTLNVPGVIGLGEACVHTTKKLRENMISVSFMKQMFVTELKKNLGVSNLRDAGVGVNGRTHLEPGKVLNLKIDGVFGETIVLMLDTLGVCISAGSACNSMEAEPSHVLLAQGLSDDEARSSIRVSFDHFNTEEEIIKAAGLLAHCINTVRTVCENWDNV